SGVQETGWQFWPHGAVAVGLERKSVNHSSNEKEHVMKGLVFTGIGLSIVAVLSVPGCITRPTMLGPDPGLAYITQRDHEMLNPEAGKNLELVQGLEDGPAAKNTMERYRSSFEKPEDYRMRLQAPSVVSQGIPSSSAGS